MTTIIIDDILASYGGNFELALNEAINSLSASGGVIQLSSQGNGIYGGEYSIGTSQKIQRLAGEELITITTNDGGQAIFNQDVGNSGFEISKSSNLRFENITFDGSEDVRGGKVVIFESQQITFNSVNSFYAAENGFLINKSEGIFFNSVESFNSAVAGFSMRFSEDIHFLDAHSEASGQHGFRLQSVNHSTFKDLRVIDSVGYGIGVQQDPGQYSEDLLFDGVYMKVLKSDGVDIKQQTIYTGEPLVTLRNFEIEAEALKGSQAAIDLRGHVLVENATVTLQGGTGTGIRFRPGNDIGVETGSGTGSTGYGRLENIVIQDNSGSPYTIGITIDKGPVDLNNIELSGFSVGKKKFFEVYGEAGPEYPVQFKNVKANNVLIENKDIFDIYGIMDGGLFTGDGGNGQFDGTTDADIIEVGDADLQGDIVGNDGDYIAAGLGHDFVRAGAGDDIVIGSFGDDEIYGKRGNDYLDGGEGSDLIIGGRGDDVLIGGAGNDILTGGSSSDIFMLSEGSGVDEITDFNVDKDQIQISSINEITFDNLVVTALSGGTEVAYSSGDDVVFLRGVDPSTLTAENFAFALLSNEISGTPNDDLIEGGESDDTISGGDGNDTLLGNDGNDILNGDDGQDQLEGGSGNDTLNGGDGNDIIFGDSGNDALDGGAGNDTLSGGDGNDVFLFTEGSGADQISDFIVSEDLIQIYTLIEMTFEDLIITSLNGGAQITYGSGGDTIFLSEIDPNSLTADNFAFNFTYNSISGTLGNDLLEGGEEHDAISGGDGDDVLLGNAGNDILNGGNGQDRLEGGLDDDALNGDEGDDTLYGDKGNDALDGGKGDDSLFGNKGDDTLNGGDGIDFLKGGNDDDLLMGGEGDDTLVGGSGADTLVGGLGSDVFVFGGDAGQDVIDDFETGVDLIQFSAQDLEFDDLMISSVEDDVVISYGEDDSITLIGADLADIGVDNFIFG